MKPAPAYVIILAAIADLAFVVLFVLIGRASHREGLLGSVNTVWPFVAALAIGWVGARAWRTPTRIRYTGIIVWSATVVVGLLLRAGASQGIQPSFVIVTAIVLALFLIGWRAVVLLVRRLRGSRRAA